MSATLRTSHLSLRVRDLARSRRFYQDVLGFRALEADGRRAAMGIDDEAGPVLVLEQAPADAGPAPAVEPEPFIGMEHFAFELAPDDFATLQAFYRRLRETETEIHHTVDHLITHSIYFLDPDRNLIEAYINCPRERYRDRMDHPYGAYQSLDAALEGREPPPFGEPKGNWLEERRRGGG